MKNINLILTGVSSALCILLTVLFSTMGNIEAAGGWGMAAVWSMNSFVYQLRDK